MRIVFTLLLLCSAISQMAWTQMAEYSTYTLSAAGASPRAITRTSDGGVVMIMNGTGSTNLVMKLNAAGLPQWQKQVTFPGYRNLVDVTETTDLGLVILSSDDSGGIILIKLTSTGTLSWTQRYNHSVSNEGTALTHNSDNGVIIVGQGCSGHNFAIYTDSTGDIVWDKQFVNPLFTFSGNNDVVQVSSTEFIITGAAQSSLPGIAYLMNVSNTGGLNWYKEYSFSFHAVPYAVVKAIGGGYTFSGTADTGPFQALMVHVDAVGDLGWDKQYTQTYSTAPNGLIQRPDGSYITEGFAITTGSLAWQGYILCTDATGGLQWQANAGNSIGSGTGMDFTTGITNGDADTWYMTGLTADGAALWYLNDLSGFCNNTVETPTVSSPTCTVTSPFVSTTTVFFSAVAVTGSTTDLTASRTNLCSTPLAVESDQQTSVISIYPSPASTDITIVIPGMEPAGMLLLDIAGRTVLTGTLRPGPNRIDLRNIQPGAYTLLASNQEIADSRRIIVIH